VVHIIAFNSQIIYVEVDNPNIKVFDADGKEADIQFSPIFDDDGEIKHDHYRLFIRVHVPALGYTTYFVRYNPEWTPRPSQIADVQLVNYDGQRDLEFLEKPVSINPREDGSY